LVLSATHNLHLPSMPVRTINPCFNLQICPVLKKHVHTIKKQYPCRSEIWTSRTHKFHLKISLRRFRSWNSLCLCCAVRYLFPSINIYACCGVVLWLSKYTLFGIVAVHVLISQFSASLHSSTELISVCNVGGGSPLSTDSATRQARAIMDYSPIGSSEIELRMNEVSLEELELREIASFGCVVLVFGEVCKLEIKLGPMDMWVWGGGSDNEVGKPQYK
jgi:hypothetical protein